MAPRVTKTESQRLEPQLTAVEQATSYLTQEQPLLAISLLETLPADPEVLTLLGVAHYRAEQYAEAAEHLERAKVGGATDERLLALLQRAHANAEADVARPVPAPSYFEQAKFPAAPGVPDLSDRLGVAAPSESSRQRVLTQIGTAAGVKVGLWLQALTNRFGGEPDTGSPWTTWSEHGFLKSMLMLARRRERLNRQQLFSAYPDNVNTSFFEQRGPIPEYAKFARTADGSYNDLADPMAGAAHTRFGFNTRPWDNPPELGARLMTPNPRTVSRELLARDSGFRPIPFLNLIAAPWIQFMNHDWVSYGEPDHRREPYRIPLDEDDPVRQTLRQTHMLVRPSQTDPSRRTGEAFSSHINEVTSWWDGSQLYGSDLQTQHALRSFVRGKMRVSEATGNLPVLEDGVEQTGFRRNWWLGLSLLHTLFVKEHNLLCDMLAVHYPKFTDQQLFDTARLINTALMAKIHTVEWTPAVLPNRALNSAMNSNWYGFLTNLLRAKNNRKTLAEINVADPVAGGLVGNTTDNHGVAYSLTREFLAVYRLHSLLPDTIDVYAVAGGDAPLRRLTLAQTRQAGSHKVSDQVAMADLFYSFGIQHSGQLVLNNYPDTLRNLSIPHAGFYDLAAVDVLRDRERGVPRYNQFRRALGLRPVRSFEDITQDEESVARLKRVYATVDDIDLLVGNLAEQHRPTGFGFGETLFEVFILNASRRLQADRFFTECYREEYYTSEGLEWVDRTLFKDVLLRHFPSLYATGLANVENAFEPWDTGALDPSRHPLRQFDPKLREADAKDTDQNQ